MILKEAILRSLEELNEPANHWAVLKHIQQNQYYDFGESKTPESTVSAMLGHFVRAGDTRVTRIKQSNGTYLYYLTQQADNFPVTADEQAEIPPKKAGKANAYLERDLHPLLSTYLQSTGIFAKTIYHEQSLTNMDSNQTWTHPDMVGIRFLKLKSPSTINFLKALNREELVKISSYEIKREVNTDIELKKAYFQAVSNSSWANYGFLVALEFGDNLSDEMERLNQSFGIGMIELNANPYLTKVLFPARYRQLDFKTIDKLCHINQPFEKFMEKSEKLMIAEARFQSDVERGMTEFCDPFFANEVEALKYCDNKNIPLEEEQRQLLDLLPV